MIGSHPAMLHAPRALHGLETDEGLPDCPARAPELDLLGPVEDMAYDGRRWMVSLANGRYFHLTERLYRVLSHADGRTACDEIARLTSADLGVNVGVDHVRRLVRDRLAPAGLVVLDSGAAARGSGASPPTPLVAIRHRARLFPYRLTAPVSAVLQHLLAPPVVAAGVSAAVLVNLWLFTHANLLGALHVLLFSPGLVLLLLVADIPLRLFHELGHASAMRRAGVRHGDIGVALYVIIPVYYTDVTHAYRLGRRDRIRVDLGGIYFDCLSTVGLFVAFQLTGLPVLLPVMVMIGFNILREFTPFVRFDGYYLMADVVGVPEPLSLIGPLLRNRLRRRNRRVQPLMRLRRPAVVALWIYLAIIAAFLLRPGLLMAALGIGQVISQLASSGAALLHQLGDAWSAGQPLALVADAAQLAFWLLIPLGLLLFCAALFRVLVRGAAGVASAVRGRAPRGPSLLPMQSGAGLGIERPHAAAERDTALPAHATGAATAGSGDSAPEAAAAAGLAVAATSDTIAVRPDGVAEPQAQPGDSDAPTEAAAAIDADPVEQAIVAANRHQLAELHRLGAEMNSLYEARLASRERDLDEMRHRLCETERDRDTMRHSLQSLEAAFARCVSELRAIGADVSQRAEQVERERSIGFARAPVSSDAGGDARPAPPAARRRRARPAASG
ncbi:MAG TPA: hypothetical protein VF155_08265 [Candidatus Dormibacteraeota bacterium]